MIAKEVSFQFGKETVTLQTGKIARQASGAVLVTQGDNVILVTAVGSKTADAGRDFFPLTVNYQEKTYAAGRIPGGYFKREGRPSERETLTSRLIDRPLRPSFPDGFTNEVQVIATVMSTDGNTGLDVLAMIGASAAISLSGMPFNGPIGGARVGYRDGEFLLNPSFDELEQSDLDLVVAGTEKAVLMVESEANLLSEEVMLDAVMFGHQAMQKAIQAIQQLKEEAGKPAWEWTAAEKNQGLRSAVESKFAEEIAAAYQVTEKQARSQTLKEIRQRAIEHFTADENSEYAENEVDACVAEMEKQLVRSRILKEKIRIDNRKLDEVRQISSEVGVLPRTHGSALFTRGETQALVVVTLGNEKDAQWIDALEGEYRENLMLHYNFPPYCVGEVGFLGSPKRREIGHGRLAKRGIHAVIPFGDNFPYVLRIVSEVTESNGSSSMASVCGSSLALMDAGIQLIAPVSGIAMGLIKDGDEFAILSDIMGDEDHLGDMDFKVAGTLQGITALQMDIKIDGITRDIMQKALAQAKAGRLHILEKMNETLDRPRTEVSQYAPRITTIKINPDKIRDIIGKGGATIRRITEETGADIDIDQDGTVKISAVDASAGEQAMEYIAQLTEEVEIGKIYEGVINKLMDFGAIVNILPNKDGLVHISQISHERVKNVEDYLSEGETVQVKVIDIDRQGRIRLSIKAMLDAPENTETEGAEEAVTADEAPRD